MPWLLRLWWLLLLFLRPGDDGNNNNAMMALAQEQQQDPRTMNGGSVLAMAGKECVAVAVDRRFGVGMELVNIVPRKVLSPGTPHTLVAFTGLEGDVQSLQQELAAQVANKYARGLGISLSTDYEDDEDGGNNDRAKWPQQQRRRQRQSPRISPRSMAFLTSHVLYNRRYAPYYVEPIVAGLEPQHRIVVADDDDEEGDGEHTGDDDRRGDDDEAGGDQSSSADNTAASASSPEAAATAATIRRRRRRSTSLVVSYRPFLCSLDCIGAQSTPSSASGPEEDAASPLFCCAGAASQSLYGTAEAMYEPDLSPEALAEVCGKAFLAALERDSLSGYGATVYVLTAHHGILEYDLVARND